jgi:hypothetical protein
VVLSLDKGSLEAAYRPWHAHAPDDVLSALSATRDGLTTDEAQKRLAQHGANVLDKKGGVSVMELIWGQINNPLIWVLIGSAVIAMLVDPVDGIKNGLVIMAVVIINTIIGFAQEFKASKAIESLSAMVPEFAIVQRDGNRVQLTPPRFHVHPIVSKFLMTCWSTGGPCCPCRHHNVVFAFAARSVDSFTAPTARRSGTTRSQAGSGGPCPTADWRGRCRT